MVFNQEAQLLSSAQAEFPQVFPKDGWLEHDPETIWQDVVRLSCEAIKKAKLKPEKIAGLGISNQRETTIIWDKATGEPIHSAIVWQDQRTMNICERWLEEGLEKTIQNKTGLLIAPYFSASKISWLLDNVPGARKRAENGELAFGTIETFLIWRFTKGQVHATDASNASRTMLFNIHQQDWDSELLAAFDIPASLLPKVKDNSDDFGLTAQDILGASMPIVAAAGDQHAAMFGQACFKKGMMKSTYGTGCFMLLNTGDAVVQSKHRLLATIAYRLNNRPVYALEGSIFIAGAAVQWLRDAVHLINNAKDTEKIATSIDSTDGVYLVPAFTGLGAPYWDSRARGAILGLSRDSGMQHIVRAALESVCYQCCDIWLAMQADGVTSLETLRVDGGMANNDWLMQFLADILQVPVERPKLIETTARGIAFLAGLQLGWYQSLDEITELWQNDHIFTPAMDEDTQSKLYKGWQHAVSQIRA